MYSEWDPDQVCVTQSWPHPTSPRLLLFSVLKINNKKKSVFQVSVESPFLQEACPVYKAMPNLSFLTMYKPLVPSLAQSHLLLQLLVHLTLPP